MSRVFARVLRRKICVPILLEGFLLHLSIRNRGSRGGNAAKNRAADGFWRNEFQRARRPIPSDGDGGSIGIQDIVGRCETSASPGALSGPKFRAHFFQPTVCARFEGRRDSNVRRLHATETRPHFGLPGRGLGRCIATLGNGSHNSNKNAPACVAQFARNLSALVCQGAVGQACTGMHGRRQPELPALAEKSQNFSRRGLGENWGETCITDSAGGWRIRYLHVGRDGRSIAFPHFDVRESGGQAVRTPGCPNSQAVTRLVLLHPSSKTHTDTPAALQHHKGRWRQRPLLICVNPPLSAPVCEAVS